MRYNADFHDEGLDLDQEVTVEDVLQKVLARVPRLLVACEMSPSLLPSRCAR
jgi:hypothetical protein